MTGGRLLVPVRRPPCAGPRQSAPTPGPDNCGTRPRTGQVDPCRNPAQGPQADATVLGTHALIAVRLRRASRLPIVEARRHADHSSHDTTGTDPVPLEGGLVMRRLDNPCRLLLVVLLALCPPPAAAGEARAPSAAACQCLSRTASTSVRILGQRKARRSTGPVGRRDPRLARGATASTPRPGSPRTFRARRWTGELWMGRGTLRTALGRGAAKDPGRRRVAHDPLHGVRPAGESSSVRRAPATHEGDVRDDRIAPRRPWSSSSGSPTTTP